MPVGFGIKYDISEKMRFYAETGLRWVFSDYLDGISKSANPKQNDTYSYLALGLTFKLGAGKDSDNDGVKDREDLCPDEPGLLAFKGCPDSDNDGVEDKKDNCPTEKGTIETKGCPDSDNDGIVDKKDDCPTVAGVSAFKGCPDTDGDGIEDKKDKCPTEKGTTERQGCPVKDSDNDGIEDSNDKCPTEKGSLQNNGCPEKKDLDSDKDGIADKDDLCPDKAGITKFNGCPDSDNDGVEDLKDNCPTEVGSISNNGCPELKKEDKQILQDAVYGVQFEQGSAIIENSSFGILDKIVDVMQRNPNTVLSIAGHTDNTGNASANQKLSEQRARACYDYLARKNIVTNRMTYQGFGASKPIDKNNTAAGRSKNRRVEFNLTSN
jgi:outer membrane protein OmpA-like peptidoglycan-associated protein